MLRLSEELSLLLLNEDGREFLRLPMWSERPLFAAAALMDLALENRIDTDLESLFVVDSRPLGDDVLDGVLERIAAVPVRDTVYWLDDLAAGEWNFHERALTRLSKRGILRARKFRTPWQLRIGRHTVKNGGFRREICERLLRVLSGEDIPAPRDIALVCLADACDLVEALFSKAICNRVEARLAQIRRMDLIGRSLLGVIWEVRSALLSGPAERPLVGLALGSGGGGGWAHVGVIRGLAEAGVQPDIVCGTSVGAMVGGFYAAGKLNVLEKWAQSLSLGHLVDYMMFSLGRTLFGNKHFFRDLAGFYQGVRIENLKMPFAAVAMELGSGREAWLREGSLLRAVSASIAYPGLFPPVRVKGRWMVDGTLVNSVPVTTCRALGAQAVVAVNLKRDRQGEEVASGFSGESLGIPTPPADVLIRPRLGRLSSIPGIRRVDDIIDEGRWATERALGTITKRFLGVS